MCIKAVSRSALLNGDVQSRRYVVHKLFNLPPDPHPGSQHQRRSSTCPALSRPAVASYVGTLRPAVSTAKPSARYGAIGWRACGRLCSTELTTRGDKTYRLRQSCCIDVSKTLRVGADCQDKAMSSSKAYFFVPKEPEKSRLRREAWPVAWPSSCRAVRCQLIGSK